MTCEMQWSGAVERMAAKFVVKGRSSEVAVAKIAPGSRLKLLQELPCRAAAAWNSLAN